MKYPKDDVTGLEKKPVIDISSVTSIKESWRRYSSDVNCHNIYCDECAMNGGINIPCMATAHENQEEHMKFMIKHPDRWSSINESKDR